MIQRSLVACHFSSKEVELKANFPGILTNTAETLNTPSVAPSGIMNWPRRTLSYNFWTCQTLFGKTQLRVVEIRDGLDQ